MKKSIVVAVASVFIAGVVMTSCNTTAEKVENAKEDVKKAEQDLEKANEAYLADVEAFRKETTVKIEENDKIISELKLKLKNAKTGIQDDYKKKMDELEQKNREMMIKLDNYKGEGKEKWEIFKAEFRHDMDELGQAFKDLTVKNVK